MSRLVAALLLACALPSPVHAQGEQSGAAATTVADQTPRQILVLLRQMPTHFRSGRSYQSTYGDATSRAARERLGRQIARENKLIFAGNWPMPLLELDCFIMTVPADQSIEAAAAQVARDANVEWAQRLNSFETMGDANDYNDPLVAVAPATYEWHLAELHKLATGAGVTVAVIDSQIESRHPDLAGQVSFTRDFVIGRPAVSEQHGTGVAGIIAAKANNRIGMAGVAPQARLMGLRACWQLNGKAGSVCDSLSLAKALHYAIERKAQVINLSLTGPPDALLGKLIDIAIARGAVVVAAADARAPSGGFPASFPGVVAVSDAKSAAKPLGVISAPGAGIPTTQTGGVWYIVNGSSYAAAHVSGLVALMRQRSARWKFASRALILVAGGGRAIDARASLRQVTRACDGDCKP